MADLNRVEQAVAVRPLTQFFELLPDPVLLLDRRATLVFANRAALRLLHCEAGTPLSQLKSSLGEAATHWLQQRVELAAKAGAQGLAPAVADTADTCPAAHLADGRSARVDWQALNAERSVVRLQLEAAAPPVRPPVPAADTLSGPGMPELVQLLWRSPFPVMVQDQNFKVVDVNPAFVDFCGFDRDRLVGTDPLDLQPEEDRPSTLAHRRAVLEGGSQRQVPALVSHRLIDANGRERWFRAAGSILTADDGRVLYLAVLQDNTAEHAARERADRSVRELDDWFDLSPVGMVLFDDAGLLVRTNPAFELLVGQVPVLLSDAPPALQQLLAWTDTGPAARLQPGSSPVVHQAWLPQPGGALSRLRSNVRCYTTAGRKRRFMAVVEDRSAEEERDLAQLQIGALMDTAGVGLATFQESSGWVRQRQTPANDANVPAGQGGPPASAPTSAALQSISRDIVLPESLPEYERLQAALRLAQRAEVRYAIRHPVLGERWLLTRVEPATLASGKRTTSVVTLDVTEQHTTQQRTEQLLREMSTILESTTAGIAYLRGKLLVRCNRRFETMLGLPAAGSSGGDGTGTGTVGRSLHDLLDRTPQGRRIRIETLQAMSEGAIYETEFSVEVPQRARATPEPGVADLSPTTRWYALSVRRTGPAADPIEAIAVLSDITRLKSQQLELETLARDQELMFSLSEVGIAFLRHGVLQRVNDALAQLAGYPAAELSGLPLQALFADGEDFERLWPREELALRQQGRWLGERQLRRRDGRLLWVQVSKRLVSDTDPAGGIIASYVNVDARHRAEQAVALQAERTRAILDSVLVGIVTVGPNGIEWMNRSARRMFGGDLADFMEAPISTVATPEAEHPFRQTQYLDDLVEGQAETFECRVKARDGREFWVVGNVVATGREATGRQLTYALLDIERRRLAEASMADAQASLQRIIEAAPMAIQLHDARTLAVLQANRAAARKAMLTQAELVGRTPEQMYVPEAAAARRQDMEQALAAPDVTQREYRASVDGEERVWDARYLPLAAPGQLPDQLLMVASDVTEQRAAQQAKFDAAIAQREMLVKEVHHRIKNNLQGVAGLLQQIAQRKPEVATVISEVVGQVQAIAQVYGLQVGATGPLRVKSVVEAIAGSVQRTFGRAIAFSIEGPAPHQWALPEAESIPIALTINELLTNAVKHSSDGQGISCRLVCSGDGVRVVVENAGRLPAGFDLARVPGGVSGLGLVRALLPRRSASLRIEQLGDRVLTTMALAAPGVSRLEPL